MTELADAVRFPSDVAVVRDVRRFVSAQCARRGLAEREMDAAAAVSELAANAVMHARTEFDVRVRDVVGGVRVEVHDGSPILPLPGALGEDAMSGRGLRLVERLSDRWGADPVPGNGKILWFELLSSHATDAQDEELTSERLLEMWVDGDDDPDHAVVPAGAPRRVVLPAVPVRELLAAKLHMENVVRELKLVLLNESTMVTDVRAGPEVVRLARRLDAAVEEFSEGRLQLRGQAMAAVARGDERVTLELRLPTTAAPAAQRYRDAVEEAERLGEDGGLLGVISGLQTHAPLRRWYLGEIIRQLQEP